MALITHQGMSEAIANLQPNPATLKGRLISLIHSYFPAEESLEKIDAIAAEDLIRQLWGIADPEDIRQKKKNLSSLKSAINKDLKNLARQGKNPEGLVIGRDNVFTISDEHKNDLLQKLGLSGALDPKDLLTLVRGILAGVMQGSGEREDASALLKELDKTREMLVRTAGINDEQARLSSGEKTAEAASGNEGEAIAGELLATDEFEILDEAEIIDEQAEIVDEEATGPSGTGLTGGALTGPGPGQGGEARGEGAAQPPADELLAADEFELLDEAEIIDEQAEIVDEEATGLSGTGLTGGALTGPGPGQGGEGAAQPPADELLAADEFELLDEAEIIDEQAEIVDEEATGPSGTGLTGGALTGPGPGQGGEARGEGAAQPAADELLAADEFEILDEAEIIDEQADIIEEDEIAPAGAIGATDDAQRDQARPLDLSHYIEPDEALASPPETLTETHDDYIAQILERFMPKFIKIPAGYYVTGRDQPAYNERPARKIFLQDFYIGQLPVTNDLFDFFVRETGYETDAEKAGFGNVVEGRLSNRIDPDTGRTILSISRGTRSQRMQGANWRHPSGPVSSLENKGNHPVVQVSRRDALAFAAWAGKRLPSEDEWEAATRGHEGLLFPWGNDWHGELANTEAALTGDTTPVTRHGKSSMSPFGVYDLLGNVFEWTATAHTPSRPASNRTPPVYVLKGGCWTSKTGITAATRLLEPDTWSNTIGFRCAV
ncbi:MAG: SUMF1/EgtB/PvdO family nonheme iron enzyme [Thermodesulfobacteriota bacterium]